MIEIGLSMKFKIQETDETIPYGRLVRRLKWCKVGETITIEKIKE